MSTGKLFLNFYGEQPKGMHATTYLRCIRRADTSTRNWRDEGCCCRRNEADTWTLIGVVKEGVVEKGGDGVADTLQCSSRLVVDCLGSSHAVGECGEVGEQCFLLITALSTRSDQ